jgi:hypothetical protein
MQPGTVRLSELAPQLLEIRHTIAAADLGLAADDRGFYFQAVCRSGDRGKTARSNRARARIDVGLVGPHVKLRPGGVAFLIVARW